MRFLIKLAPSTLTAGTEDDDGVSVGDSVAIVSAGVVVVVVGVDLRLIRLGLRILITVSVAGVVATLRLIRLGFSILTAEEGAAGAFADVGIVDGGVLRLINPAPKV